MDDRSLQSTIDARRYRIIGVLGRGGFGTVYHARLEGGDGFVKDVAIKILHNPHPPPDALARFRDEARILGRLRDRAIVSVDPPTRLDGRWAVVMEFADGADCRRLLREHGRLPVRVVLQIVEEVARCLENLWTHPDEDGQPMQLLHRDLKPSNLQVTPAGSVKILDFGVARADFSQRESSTDTSIAGTLGYIAPERIDGVEDAPGDVYSLGVVLEELLTGQRPSRPGEGPETAALHRYEDLPPEVLTLSMQMRSLDPRKRPTASEVEQRCAALAQVLAGPSLREWARERVQRIPLAEGANATDALVGQTLSETFVRHTSRVPLAARGRSPVGWALAFAGIALTVAGAAFGVSGLGLLVWLGLRPAPVADEVVAVAPLPPIVAPGTADPVRSPASGLQDPAPPPAPAPDPDLAQVPPPGHEPEPVPAPAAPRKTTSRKAPPPPAPPQPSRPSGTVSFYGADAIELSGDAGRFGGGMVPAGTYSVRARFDGGAFVSAGSIRVAEGARVKLRCDPRFMRCVPE